MALINTSLLTPRNIAVIAVITAVTHVVAKPLYARIGKKG